MGWQRRRETIFVAWMFENAKVNALFVRLYAPGDRVMFRDLDPADEVTLREWTVSIWLVEYSAYNKHIHLPWSERQCSLFPP